MKPSICQELIKTLRLFDVSVEWLATAERLKLNIDYDEARRERDGLAFRVRELCSIIDDAVNKDASHESEEASQAKEAASPLTAQTN